MKVTSKMLMRKGWRKIILGFWRETYWVHPIHNEAYKWKWAREKYIKDLTSKG